MKDNSLKKICPRFVHQVYSDVKYWVRFKCNPKGIASELFRGILGYEIDWENPKDINEKINWMKFNYDTSIWSQLADKYLVRQYVKERIGDDVLPKLYGKWSRSQDVDFNSLPSKFVLKTNHGCGTIIPVHNKSEIDLTATKDLLDKWLHTRYGYKTIEPHYLSIKPFIIAEEFLENDSPFSSSLVDYKVFCFSGKPYCILVCTDRILREHTNLSFYSCDWEPIQGILAGHHKGEEKIIPRPLCLPKLLEYSSLLAQGHPQVRVDFYIVKNKLYFGEMTFTSQGGYMDYISRNYSLEMGQLVNLQS